MKKGWVLHARAASHAPHGFFWIVISCAHKDYYEKILWDKQHPYGDVYNTFVAEAVAKALTGAYPAEKGKELLYQILVKPFCNEKIGGKK